MSQERKARAWAAIRKIGLNMAAAGMGGGFAINMAEDDVPVPYWLMATSFILVAAGCALLFAANQIGSQPFPRFWFMSPRPEKDSGPAPSPAGPGQQSESRGVAAEG